MNRPNIILLVGEDTGLHLGCYGDTYASTPHLDRLAAEGARYTHAFSTSPVCAPSRSTLVTGMYPWSIGTHHMRTTLRRPPRLFTYELRDGGYYVNWPTKRDFNFEPTAGWCDAGDEDATDIDWLPALRHGALPEKPFFLYANFFVTHESTMWPGAFGADVGAHKLRADFDRLLQPDQRHDPAAAPVPSYLPDTPPVRENIAWYYDALAIQDAQIGAVLDGLEASPYRDNTVVIYLTDHGRGLPREKRWCYDAGLHLPLLVRGAGARGEESSTLVSWVDVAPTILSLANVPIPEHYQGRPFLGPARNDRPRKYVFAGRDRIGETYDHVRTARDERWHYIRNTWPRLPYAQPNAYMDRLATTRALRTMRDAGTLTGPPALWMRDAKPAEELYDTHADPQMVNNLASPVAAAPICDVLHRMRAALDEHLASVGDLGTRPERALINEGLIEDSLSRVCAARDAAGIAGAALRTVCERDEARAV